MIFSHIWFGETLEKGKFGLPRFFETRVLAGFLEFNVERAENSLTTGFISPWRTLLQDSG